jgi:tRNA (guanine-N7-)-methyltransferase
MRRQGRMSDRQKNALQLLLPRFGIDYTTQNIDLDLCFGRAAAKVLEIGFGMGHSLIQLAKDHPDMDFLGIEVHEPGVGSLLAAMHEQGISNVRVICHDAVEVLQHCIASDTFAAVNIYFPDPWPKKRHHKRRLIQTAFVTTLLDKMKTGAQLHIATDWQPYAEWIEIILNDNPSLHRADQAAVFSRAITKFEQRGLELGHRVYELLFYKSKP